MTLKGSSSSIVRSTMDLIFGWLNSSANVAINLNLVSSGKSYGLNIQL